MSENWRYHNTTCTAI